MATRVIQVRPGLVRMIYGEEAGIKKQRTGFVQFKPLKIKHGTKEGSPMLHSRKEANQWLNKHGLYSPVFTD